MKNLNKTLNVVALSATLMLGMSAFQSAFAQTSVNGGDVLTPHDPSQKVIYLKGSDDKNPLKNIILREGGTNSGHTVYYNTWCNDAGSQLDQAELFARAAFRRMDFRGAKESLTRGLKNELSRVTDPAAQEEISQSIPFRVLNQGIKIAHAMPTTIYISDDVAKDQALIMFSYYKYVREAIAASYSVYNEPSPEYGSFDPRAVRREEYRFEGRYVSYVRDQLKWLLSVERDSSFLYIMGRGMNDLDINVGTKQDSEVFFKIAEVVVSFAAASLHSDPIVQGKFECTAQHLDTLVGEINNRTSLGDAPYALSQLYPKLLSAENEIGQNCLR